MFVFLAVLCFFLSVPYHLSNAATNRETYDQSQRGKVNVHLSLKNFEVIELFGTDDVSYLPEVRISFHFLLKKFSVIS